MAEMHKRMHNETALQTSTPSPREICPLLTQLANATQQSLTAHIGKASYGAAPRAKQNGVSAEEIRAQLVRRFPGIELEVDAGDTSAADQLLAALNR